jgi:hypothetical protein
MIPTASVSVSSLDLAAIAIYLAAMLDIAFCFARSNTSPEEYFAGRRPAVLSDQVAIPLAVAEHRPSVGSVEHGAGSGTKASHPCRRKKVV